MNLDLNKEQKILMKSAREFLKKECLPSLLKDMHTDPMGYSKAMWKKMAELGWMGVMIPEEYGGSGGDFVDLAIILEAMGEVNCPGPFFSTVVIGALAVMKTGTESQKKEILTKIADGNIILAYAMNEPGVYYDASIITMDAKDDGDAYILNGTKLFVDNAQIADFIICVVRTSGQLGSRQGLTLLLVDAKSTGIQCSMLNTLAMDKQCEVVFDNVRVLKKNLLGRPDRAWDLLESLNEQVIVAKCAELVGCMQTAFDMTVDYAKHRKQFGQAIGSFQAVQHHCANMVMELDGARFLTYKAAWEVAKEMPSSKSSAMAKAWTGGAAGRVTTLAHQIHGAIGFCEEMDLHLYYRRARAGEVFFGDSDYHLEKVARNLGL